MTVQVTSLLAYMGINISKREKEVLDYFLEKEDYLANIQVAEGLGWPINRVTGRTNGLVKKGILKKFGRIKINGEWHTVMSPLRKQEQLKMEGICT